LEGNDAIEYFDPNDQEKMITEDNKLEYVRLVTNFLLADSIKK